MKRSVEGESGRDAHILASAPSLEAAPQRSAGTPHGIGATPWGTKSATRRARFAHVCAGGAPATGVASGANGRATKPTSQGPGVVRGTATDMGEYWGLLLCTQPRVGTGQSVAPAKKGPSRARKFSQPNVRL